MIELLSPAGSLQKLHYAIAYGADAVYLGLPFFSLRARENEFDVETIQEGIKFAHAHGKKVYVTANIFSRNRKLNQFETSLRYWRDLKPDALIMSDPGLIMRTREILPEIPVHLSVQANCMNWRAAEFWHKYLGITRIILSRELNIDEIKEIKQRLPDLELEAFVHGSICIAYSGRCLLSSYFSYRDANQGVCDNSCREKFHLYSQSSPENNFFVEDLRNSTEYYQIDEDENGTFIMNSKDLRLIEYLKLLIDAGVESFKIEGRTKSVYYVSLVTRAYRQAIDDIYQLKPFNPCLLDELEKVANRGYHSGFLIQNPDKDSFVYDSSISRNFSQIFGGIFLNKQDSDPEGFARIDVRSQLNIGDNCEIIAAHGFQHSIKITSMKNKNGEYIEKAHSGAGVHFIQLDFSPPAYSILSVKKT